MAIDDQIVLSIEDGYNARGGGLKAEDTTLNKRDDRFIFSASEIYDCTDKDIGWSKIFPGVIYRIKTYDTMVKNHNADLEMTMMNPEGYEKYVTWVRLAGDMVQELITMYGHRGLVEITSMRGYNVQDYMNVKSIMFPTLSQDLSPSYKEMKNKIVSYRGKIDDAILNEINAAVETAYKFQMEYLSGTEGELVRAKNSGSGKAVYDPRDKVYLRWTGKPALLDGNAPEFWGAKTVDKSEQVDDVKECAACAELIKTNARVCRYCGLDCNTGQLYKHNIGNIKKPTELRPNV